MVLRIDAVRARLGRLEEVISELEAFARLDRSALRASLRDRWAVERGLQLGAEILFDIGNHILVAQYGVSPQDHEDVAEQRLGAPPEEISEKLTLEEVNTMLAESIDRWNREIREEGRQEGRQEGEARVVLRLLRLKFGPLDLETEEQVRSADADRLLGWSERILTAKRLQDVLRD